MISFLSIDVLKYWLQNQSFTNKIRHKRILSYIYILVVPKKVGFFSFEVVKTSIYCGLIEKIGTTCGADNV